jgi:fructokinase
MTRVYHVIGLGEVLWDVFPAGPRFGGAPANFVCSAAAVGGVSVHTSMVSAVGRDYLGAKGLEEFRKRSVDATHVAQLDLQTGQVLVQLDAQGQAGYKFMEGTAWDNIPWTSGLQSLAENADAVCFGTLGQRSAVSRDTIRQFVKSTSSGCLRVLDINLRSPYWTDDTILVTLLLANVLKLNSDELPIVASLLSLEGSEDELMLQLLRMFNLRLAALTRGAGGSLLLSGTGERSELPGERIRVVDSVGAGDAFTAALTVGLLKNLPLAEVHSRAERIAAFVCTQAGATPEFPGEFRC